ncbi:MAG: radical SAM protein [Thermodesulfobacteriota bacterium]|nr:radical SAM protein [Thermodesulfobacteriota bacterium]
MKCVLAMPSWSLAESHSKAMAKSVAGVWPPPGLMSIAAVLREAGHDVIILDGTLLSQEEIVKGIMRFEADFVGIYAVSLLWPKTKDLALRIRERRPDIFIAVGGPMPSFFKEKCIEECSAIDAVCFGEGEYTAREIVERLEKGESLEGCKGTIINSKEGIIRNLERPLIEDIDALPPYALDLVEMHRYTPPIGHYSRLPIAQMMSARGCPLECIYCYRVNGKTIRLKSAKNVVDEMEHYAKNFGVKEIKFWDDLFTFDKERVFEICDEIRRRNLNLTWFCASRIDTINEDLLKSMAEAGCWCILYGIETGVSKNQKTIKKNLDLSRAEETIRLTHKHGIKSYATFILGIPGETYEDGLETIRFAKKLNAYYTEFFTFTPFPGSPVYSRIEKYGTMSHELCDTGMHKMGFVPHSMTREELSKLCTLSYKSVYLRPKYIVRQFLSVKSWLDITHLLRGAVGIGNMVLGRHTK